MKRPIWPDRKARLPSGRKPGKKIDWFSPATAVFNPDSGVYGRWFDGATCSTCYNCVDRHAMAGHGARTAIIYDSPVTGQTASYSFEALQTQVGALASVLRGRQGTEPLIGAME